MLPSLDAVVGVFALPWSDFGHVSPTSSSSNGVGGYGKLVLLELVVPLVGAGDVDLLWPLLLSPSAFLLPKADDEVTSPSFTTSGMLTVNENTLPALVAVDALDVFFVSPLPPAPSPFDASAALIERYSIGGLRLARLELLATDPLFEFGFEFESRSTLLRLMGYE